MSIVYLEQFDVYRFACVAPECMLVFDFRERAGAELEQARHARGEHVREYLCDGECESAQPRMKGGA